MNIDFLFLSICLAVVGIATFVSVYVILGARRVWKERREREQFWRDKYKGF